MLFASMGGLAYAWYKLSRSLEETFEPEPFDAVIVIDGKDTAEETVEITAEIRRATYLPEAEIETDNDMFNSACIAYEVKVTNASGTTAIQVGLEAVQGDNSPILVAFIGPMIGIDEYGDPYYYSLTKQEIIDGDGIFATLTRDIESKRILKEEDPIAELTRTNQIEKINRYNDSLFDSIRFVYPGESVTVTVVIWADFYLLEDAGIVANSNSNALISNFPIKLVVTAYDENYVRPQD